MAQPSLTGAEINSAMKQILELYNKFPNRMTEKVMEENLKDVRLECRAAAINALLRKNEIKVLKQGDIYIYERAEKLPLQLRNMSREDMLLYEAIKSSGNKGLWTKDIKAITNLPQVQMTRSLKNLENKGSIKSVKNNSGKKVYMLTELTPSKELTGGAWYSGQNFDAEFADIIKKGCLQFVKNQGIATIENIEEFIRKSELSKVDLKADDLKQIMDMLILDKEIEETVSSGIGEFRAIPINKRCYRVAQSHIQETSAFTSIPCGVCPVLRECTEDGPISPATCVYFQKWLSF